MLITAMKIRLRPLTQKDLPTCFAWIQDSMVTRYLGFDSPKTMKEERLWLKKIQRKTNELIFAIETKKPKKYIGNVGIHEIDRRIRSCSIGIVIGDRASWDQGFGTDTVKAVLEYCFTKLQMHKVSLVVDPDNHRAIRVYKKCGFKKEGYLKDDTFKGGRYRDSVLMAVLG